MVRLERMGPVQLERLTGLLYTAKTATDIPSKLENLLQFNEELLPDADTSSLSNFLHILFELQFDRQSPVRKVVTQIIGEIGLKRLEFVPEIVPVLLKVLDDPAPAVARQAVASGNDLFQYTLERVVTQGLHTSELDDMLKSAWSSMLELKEKIYSIAFQPGSSGVRFLALKFVEALVLLYTPDPRVPQERPAHDGKLVEFNILWLRGGHPLLNIGDLSVEASKRMSLLLDQLRFPAVKSLSNLVIIVLINCLATIAKKRPPYYGRILPVLLGLDPSCSIIEGRHASGVHLALKKAFVTLLKCTHPGAAPWRERLLGALRQMKGGFADGEIQESVKRSGRLEGEKEGSLHENDSKPSGEAFDGVHIKSERSSFGTDDANDFPEDDARSRKRLKSETQDENSSQEPMSGSDDTGPVQQLVAMFGALVAQGEKAVGSLEILISSISADLLAEVVMANMRYLPTNYPQGERDDELVEDMTVFGSDTHAKYPSSFLSDVLSLSRSFQPVASQLNTRRSSSNEVMIAQEDELNGAAVGPSSVVSAGISLEAENEMFPAGVQTPSTALVTKIEMDGEDIPLAIHDENLASKIPGLESFPHTDRFSESMGGSSLVFTGVADVGQDQVTSSVARSNADSLPVTSGDRSEELSSRTAVTDSNSLFSSTATSVLASAVVLPKMSAPVVNLANEQKDQLQDLAFTRIIEAYKHISISGGSQVRFSLLACLGFEFPSDLDPWKLLQKHILEDYVSHEGHELTLRVLYRLFREIEEERDFFSSTTATNVYEIFLLNVAETLRDSFPPSDKSLSRLLGEAPYLPKPVLALLESLCSPGKSDKTEKDAQNGNRVTQGLSIVWSLILLRPPLREVCLKIALQSAVHHLEEVRMKAIRLVANKLYPLSSIAQQIETFAMESMSSAVNNDATENIATESSTAETQKTTMSENQTNEHQSTRDIDKDFSTNSHQSSKAQSSPLLSFTEAQRCMSLYFALCTKKHSLFHQVFVIYKDASKDVKQAIHSHIPILVRTMGRSTELLKIISDPPTGSEDLLMQVLKILTEGTVPSPELLLTIKKLFNSKIKDAEILFPILPFLPREEVLQLFRHLVNLPIKKFQVALGCVLQGSSNSAPVLSPTEVLIAIHEIDPERDGVPLKKVTDACNACFEQRQIFTQQVLAKVLNQLVEQIPLPLLFMRTVLQAIGAFPALMEFVMDILARLVSKQIWKYPKLWVGFLKCTQLTKPHSFHVLLKLPSPQLENALNKIADLKAPLVAHASQPDIRSTLPRSTLLVLGLISEAQTSGPAQSGQGQTVDTVNQPPTPPIETTVETSNEAQTVDRSNPAPAAETSNQAQTVDTSNSDKDKLTEKSVESPSKDMQTQDSKEPMSSSS